MTHKMQHSAHYFCAKSVWSLIVLLSALRTRESTATHCSTLHHTATHCNTLQLELDRTTRECNVWQCVAVCCSVLQRVAACCSVLQRVAVCCSVLQRVAACCSVLQRVAACCSVLQRVAACCSMSDVRHRREVLLGTTPAPLFPLSNECFPKALSCSVGVSTLYTSNSFSSI